MLNQHSVPLTPSGQDDIVTAQATIADWMRLVRAEYLEIPGLHLTRQQVRRLWGLDELTCDALLDALVAGNFLRQTATGAYILRED